MKLFLRNGFGSLAMATAVASAIVWQAFPSAWSRATARPATSNHAKFEGFKFEFDYSEAGDDFTDEVKQQIEDAGRFLAGYIGDDMTVKVKIVASGDVTALATGAASARSENTEEKSISTEGGIRFRSSVIGEAGQGKTSVFALTVHELMHVLGFSQGSKAFDSKVKGGKFTGENAVKMNAGQDVRISGSHFPRGFKDSRGMSPRVSDGGGDKLSILDLAVLADLGYNIPIIEGKDEPPVLGFVVRPSDFILFNVNGKPLRMMQGYAGNDTLIAGDHASALQGQAGEDTLFSGKGDDLLRGDPLAFGPDANIEPSADTFVIPAEPGNDTIEGFEEKDTIVLSPALLNGEEIEKILEDKEKFMPNGNFVGQWVLKLGDVKIIIKHRDVQEGGNPPTKDNFKIEDREAPK